MRRRKTAAVARSDSSADLARQGEKRKKKEKSREGQSPLHAGVPGGARWFINYSFSATQRYDEMEPLLRRSRSQPHRDRRT